MIEIKVPQLAESITEGTVVKWLKGEGSAVAEGDMLVELETDKVNMEIPAEHAGVLSQILKGPGETVQVGETIAVLSEGGEAPAPAVKPAVVVPAKETQVAAAAPAAAAPAPASAAAPAPAAAAGDDARLLATPAARKLAREQSIDLSQVRGTDPFGRLTGADVKTGAVAAPAPAPAPAALAPAAPAKAAPAIEGNPAKPAERVKMSRRRQTIANRLVAAQHTAAMLTTFNEVDMTAIMDLRKRRQDSFVKKHGVKLGFMSFFTKAVVGALKAFPLLNAEIQGDELLVKKFYDIGIAVAATEGLVVPVVRDADKLSFAAIEKEIARLAERARGNQLSLAELQGGTFTITNGGTFGSLLSTPILNAPQVGILGMHTIKLRPVAIDATRMENRPMMNLALSYDHRIVDGAEAVQFLVKVKEMLEDPENLLIEG